MWEERERERKREGCLIIHSRPPTRRVVEWTSLQEQGQRQGVGRKGRERHEMGEKGGEFFVVCNGLGLLYFFA